MALADLNTKSAAEAGVTVDIVHPVSKQPLGIRVIVCGSDSDTYRSIMRKQQNKRLEAAKKGKAVITAEQLESERLDLLCGCVKKWEEKRGDNYEPNIELAKNEYVDCTPENIRRVFGDSGFSWLRDQIDEAIGDIENFLGR